MIPAIFGLYAVAIQTSMAAMEFLGWLLFVIFLVRFIKQRAPWSQLKTGVEIPFAIFFLAIVLGAFRSWISPHEAGHMIGWSRWILLFYGFYFLLRENLNRKWEKGYFIYLGVGILLSIYAFTQFEWGIELIHKARPLDNLGGELPGHWRAEGFFNICLTFAYMIGIVGITALATSLLFWQAGRRRVALFAVFAYLATWVGIFSSLSRGAWFSFAAGSVLVLMIFSPRKGAVFAGAGAAVAAALIAFVKPLHARFLTMFDGGFVSNSLHTLLWKSNFMIFRDHPILGVGLEQNEKFERVYYSQLGFPDLTYVSHAHNNILQVMACLGIIGTIAYIWFCVFFMKKAWELYREADDLWYKAIGLGSLGAQVHFHLGGLTQWNFGAAADNHNLIFVWAVTLAALTQLHERKGQGQHAPQVQ